MHLYDGINLAALAMLASHSTNSKVIGPYIQQIGNGVPGAKVVYSFAQGAAALKAGQKIRYEGPGGPTSFDAYHDSAGSVPGRQVRAQRSRHGGRQPVDEPVAGSRPLRM